MAEIKWISVNEKLSEPFCDVLIGVQNDKEQRLDIVFGHYDSVVHEWIMPDEFWLAHDVALGYARVVAWANLGDFYDALDDFILHGTRKLQSL